MISKGLLTHLFHDSRLSLAKGNVPSRFVGNVLYPDLSSTRLSVLIHEGETAWDVVVPRALGLRGLLDIWGQLWSRLRLTIELVFIVVII